MDAAAWREGLPLWVRLGPLLYVAAAGPFAYLTGLLMLRVGGVRAAYAPGLSWPERARLAWTGRLGAAWNAGMQGAAWAVLGYTLAGPGALPSRGLVSTGCLLAGVFVGLLPSRRAVARLVPGFPRAGAWLAGQIAQLFTARAVILVLLAAVLATGQRLDLRTAIAGAASALLLAAVHLGWHLRLGRSLGLLRAPSEALRRAVERASAGAVRPARLVLEIPLGVCNAYALPLGRTLIASRELVAALDEEELTSVCAHELGHLAEPRRILVSRVVLTAELVAGGVIVPPLLVQHDLGLAVALYFAFLASALAFRSLGRKAEVHADEAAHGSGSPPGVYGRALEKLYRANLVPAVLRGKGGAHPHLYDRMVADGAQPSWPRPEPPPRGRARACLALAALFAGATYAGVSELARLAGRGHPRVALALEGGNAPDLSLAAYELYRAGALDDSATLYRAAAFASRRSAFYVANLAIVLANGHRCKDAAAALADARTRRAAPAADALEKAKRATERCVPDGP